MERQILEGEGDIGGTEDALEKRSMQGGLKKGSDVLGKEASWTFVSHRDCSNCWEVLERTAIV